MVITTCLECDRLRLDLAEAYLRGDLRTAMALFKMLKSHRCRQSQPILAAGLWPERRVIVMSAQENL